MGLASVVSSPSRPRSSRASFSIPQWGFHVDEQIALRRHRARLEQEGDVEDDRRDVARVEVAGEPRETPRGTWRSFSR